MQKNSLLATFLELLPRTVEIGAATPEELMAVKC